MSTVRLGFAVGTGEPVDIPLAHTFVTGQTQLSGKTTALEAIATRSGRAALAFLTKRGESLEGRRIRPYLPREGDQPIHWRLVETIMASALGQRHLKWERFQILNAARGARSLADVRANLTKLAGTKKSKSRTEETYTLLGEYLDLVLPEMQALHAADVLPLLEGLNVMDLSDVSPSLQALVIRAALARINKDETHILTVLPEAWQFAPRDLNAPAKDEAIHMARKGAAPSIQNYLLCDSQDIAGVAPVLRQASSVWILGVQRELNEVKRLLAMIPGGIAKPKAHDVFTLSLGEFFVCVGSRAVKTYVQPSWMPDGLAQQVARGIIDVQNASSIARARMVMKAAEASGFTPVRAIAKALSSGGPMVAAAMEEKVTKAEADALQQENERLRKEIEALREQLDQLQRDRRERPPRAEYRQTAPPMTAAMEVMAEAGEPFAAAEEAFYQRLKARLMVDAPAILQVLAMAPALEITVERPVLQADGDSVKGRIARLLSRGFFKAPQSGGVVQKELASQGMTLSPGSLYPALDELAKLGFLRITDGKDDRSRPRKEYQAVPEMVMHVRERKAS